MLRNRSRRAVGGGAGGGGAKQGGGAGGLMAELPVATATAAAAQSPRHPSSSSSSSAAAVFSAPRPFMAMALPQAGLLDYGAAEAPSSAMSPTSILETKQFCCSGLPPFLSERSLRRAHHLETAAAPPKPAGVGLADVLREHVDAKLGGGKVVFGSQLRIQVPSARAVELVSSPIEFGAKNRDAQLAVLSPARRFLPEVLGSPSARVFAGAVARAPGEMAMSEDYTCVISRGPNPRTRHIFDDCIVESCGDVLVEKMGKGAGAADDGGAAVASGFLSSCHACNKQLGRGNDIFIYRGDKAFCSSECRYQEMLFDEAVDNLR